MGAFLTNDLAVVRARGRLFIVGADWCPLLDDCGPGRASLSGADDGAHDLEP